MIDPTFHAPPVDSDSAVLAAIGRVVAEALREFVAAEASRTVVSLSVGPVAVVRGTTDGLRLAVTVTAGPDVIEAVKKELAKWGRRSRGCRTCWCWRCSGWWAGRRRTTAG